MAKDSLRKLSLRELTELIQADGRDAAEARRTLKEAAQELWEDIAFRALKAGVPVDDAAQEANDCVGRNWTERFDRALAGILDEIRGLTHKQAVANAQQLLDDWLVAGPGEAMMQNRFEIQYGPDLRFVVLFLETLASVTCESRDPDDRMWSTVEEASATFPYRRPATRENAEFLAYAQMTEWVDDAPWRRAK